MIQYNYDDNYQLINLFLTKDYYKKLNYKEQNREFVKVFFYKKIYMFFKYKILRKYKS